MKQKDLENILVAGLLSIVRSYGKAASRALKTAPRKAATRGVKKATTRKPPKASRGSVRKYYRA